MLQEIFQSREKPRKGNIHYLRVANASVAFRAQGSDGAGHGDAVIAEGFNFGTMKWLPTSYTQTIIEDLDPRTKGAQIFCHGCDAVRFLDSQFAGIADFNSVLGVRSNRR